MVLPCVDRGFMQLQLRLRTRTYGALKKSGHHVSAKTAWPTAPDRANQTKYGVNFR